MKKYCAGVVCLALIFSLASCGRKPKVTPGAQPAAVVPAPVAPAPVAPPAVAPAPVVKPIPEYRYAKDAVRLHLQSDPQLNLFQSNPHTVLVCVYQLSDPNSFNQLQEETEGLAKLLECSRFDPSVASFKRLVMQPGQELTQALDRAEGAKYVGLVAGYFNMQKSRMVRLQAVPVHEATGQAGILKIDFYLGPQEIQEPRGK